MFCSRDLPQRERSIKFGWLLVILILFIPEYANWVRSSITGCMAPAPSSVLPLMTQLSSSLPSPASACAPALTTGSHDVLTRWHWEHAAVGLHLIFLGACHKLPTPGRLGMLTRTPSPTPLDPEKSLLLCFSLGMYEYISSTWKYHWWEPI